MFPEHTVTRHREDFLVITLPTLDYAIEVNLLVDDIAIKVSLTLAGLVLRVKGAEVYAAIKTARNETRVVGKPLNALGLGIMVFVSNNLLIRVEVVHVDRVHINESIQMTTIGELDLTTALSIEVCKLFYLF